MLYVQVEAGAVGRTVGSGRRAAVDSGRVVAGLPSPAWPVVGYTTSALRSRRIIWERRNARLPGMVVVRSP